jgi:hypothetical protein
MNAPRIVLTMMVRDEADIVGSMLTHHQNQGIYKAIVTDNGSVDGTLEILKTFEAEGFVDLRIDPVHKKQQSECVTHMARDAFNLYQADWVINADADEFWIAQDHNKTIVEASASFEKQWKSFNVPVLDMTGPPAKSGTGLSRLSWIDQRTDEKLKSIGINAHSTHDCLHIGDPSVEVSQGNHFVSLPSLGSPQPSEGLEVLHFQWRSWAQFSRKVHNAGKAYLANPDLTPSPKHHGMKDFRRLEMGTLESIYILRHPSAEELAGSDFERIDTKIILPQSTVDDVMYPSEQINEYREKAKIFIGFEKVIEEQNEELLTARHQVKIAEYQNSVLEEQFKVAQRDLRNPLRYIKRGLQSIWRRITRSHHQQ